jgi:3-hydroxybutyryl-CoA dehydratase
MSANAYTFNDITVGQKGSLNWRVSEEEIDRFADLSGDRNPLHVEASFARSKGFPSRVAHGVLLASKISAFAGMVLPGRNCLLLELNVSWPTPIYAGDEVTIDGEVIDKSDSVGALKIAFRARKTVDSKAKTVGRGWYLCKVQS